MKFAVYFFVCLYFFNFLSDAAVIRIVRPVKKVLSAASGPATLATDNFNRANSDPIGGNWTTMNSQGSMQVSANTITYSSSVSDAGVYYNAVTWPNDQYSQIKVTTAATGAGGAGLGVVCRSAAGANTYYRLIVDAAGASNVQLRKVVAGTGTTIWTRTVTFVSGQLLRLEVQGTTLRAYYNGAQIGADATDSAISAGNAGVFYSSLDANSSGDDWEGGSL